ncbi:MAG: 16S rRNA (uracil(1498)-N(3))-methyltransferase [Alphaproteobacteria bacterium]|nr:MAG: 16S rRNA (uracil(1498)-N(3))-methyltransferase [Alphaproteobacteria bacterium]
MIRLYIEALNSDFVKLDSDQVHYLKNVMRVVDNSFINIFDDSKEFEAKVVFPYVNIVKLVREKQCNKLPKIGISFIRPNRLEIAIAKATELGAEEIFLLKTERVNHNYHRVDRLKKICIESAEQCNRIGIPKLHMNISLEMLPKYHWIIANKCEQEVQFWNADGILIGPEGGWSANDLEKLSCYKQINIHQNILRAETAVCTALSLFKI